MRRAVVTGAGGFLGSALVRELAAGGVRVLAVVRSEGPRTARLKEIAGVEIVCCDMEELASLPQKTNELRGGGILPSRLGRLYGCCPRRLCFAIDQCALDAGCCKRCKSVGV